MSANNIGFMESLGKLTGSLIGFMIVSTITTWTGLLVLNYFNWLPI
jgi:hypothetical protein